MFSQQNRQSELINVTLSLYGLEGFYEPKKLKKDLIIDQLIIAAKNVRINKLGINFQYEKEDRLINVESLIKKEICVPIFLYDVCQAKSVYNVEDWLKDLSKLDSQHRNTNAYVVGILFNEQAKRQIDMPALKNIIDHRAIVFEFSAFNKIESAVLLRNIALSIQAQYQQAQHQIIYRPSPSLG